jgi:hypothetical protein
MWHSNAAGEAHGTPAAPYCSCDRLLHNSWCSLLHSPPWCCSAAAAHPPCLAWLSDLGFIFCSTCLWFFLVSRFLAQRSFNPSNRSPVASC